MCGDTSTATEIDGKLVKVCTRDFVVIAFTSTCNPQDSIHSLLVYPGGPGPSTARNFEMSVTPNHTHVDGERP